MWLQKTTATDNIKRTFDERVQPDKPDSQKTLTWFSIYHVLLDYLKA